MALMTKVLAILNAVAALAFLLVGALDYGARQSWTTRVQQLDFVLNGLPVDDNEKSVQGGPLVDLFPEGMAKRLFEGNGEPVRTQKAEVQRRKSQLEQAVNAAADKKPELEKILVPLARTLGQRQDLQQRIRTGSVDALMAPDGLFAAAFREALDGRNAAGQELGLTERRDAIAHLLFNTSQNLQDYQRALITVGLQNYVHEVDSQASDLAAMLPELQAAMGKERAANEIAHAGLLRQIITQHERLQDLDGSLRKAVALREQQKTLINTRNADIDELKKQIDDTQKALAAALALQSRLETDLFEADREVAHVGEQNQRLLKQLESRERGR